MVEVATICLEFLIVFLLVYLLNYIFYFKKMKKFDRKKAPVNIKYLMLKYNLDIVKLGYKRLCKNLLIVDAFIISLMFSVTRFIDNVYIRLIVAFILIFPLFAGIYHLVAIYYIKESE